MSPLWQASGVHTLLVAHGQGVELEPPAEEETKEDLEEEQADSKEEDDEPPSGPPVRVLYVGSVADAIAEMKARRDRLLREAAEAQRLREDEDAEEDDLDYFIGKNEDVQGADCYPYYRSGLKVRGRGAVCGSMPMC